MATPQSTDDLITFANSIYLELNESPQASTSNSLGTKVKTAISSALVDLCTLTDWSWMLSFQTPSSWSSQVATLPANVRKIKFAIQERSGAGARSIPYLNPQAFYRQNLTSFTGAGGGIVRNYTQLEYLDVAVNPYPADSASQAEVKFYVVRFAELPTSDTGKFAVPDEFMSLLRKKATANFAMSHLGDLALSQAFNQDFELLASRYRSLIRNVPPTGSTMYRNFRN